MGPLCLVGILGRRCHDRRLACARRGEGGQGHQAAREVSGLCTGSWACLFSPSFFLVRGRGSTSSAVGVFARRTEQAVDLASQLKFLARFRGWLFLRGGGWCCREILWKFPLKRAEVHSEARANGTAAGANTSARNSEEDSLDSESAR